MEMRGRTVCKDGLEGVYAVCDDQACTGLCQLFSWNSFSCLPSGLLLLTVPSVDLKLFFF